jgi:hypothetical protein
MIKDPTVLRMNRPSKDNAAVKPMILTPPQEGTKRLVVDIPISKHMKLKQLAAERGISVKALVLELLQNGAGI